MDRRRALARGTRFGIITAASLALLACGAGSEPKGGGQSNSGGSQGGGSGGSQGNGGGGSQNNGGGGSGSSNPSGGTGGGSGGTGSGAGGSGTTNPSGGTTGANQGTGGGGQSPGGAPDAGPGPSGPSGNYSQPMGTIVDPPCSDRVDNVAPSIDPPGGLPANKVPMFVLLGVDDNGHADGIHWMLDDLNARKNPDGTAVRAAFFISGGFAREFFHEDGHQTKDDVLNAWKRIKADGHEIGNHSWSHGTMLQGTDQATWLAEITKANELFEKTLGVERCKINGFRTPFLAFSQATFSALKSSGLSYDTSVEFGYDWWQPPGSNVGWGGGTAESGRHYYWPFTMNAPFPNGFASKGVGPSPGIWEFPMYTFNKITGETAATVTGLDFNLWLKNQNEPSFEFATILKMSLDQRLSGNRSPLNLGLHSDIYSQWDEDSNKAFSKFSYQQRRDALKTFLDYAQSKPEVRIVTYRQLIAWMRDPKPL